MSERLLSVGLDVGTTSTQMVVSELTVENRASGFAVPEMTIAQRRVLYKSPVYFTPLLGEDLVDGEGIRGIVDREYKAAGLSRESVDTGAIIITGETSRKENAQAVLNALSDYAGEFVVATAGPDLESALAAKGAGAAAYSEATGKRVLHIDIGGGTSNFACIENGAITATYCLNVGGRLLKFAEDGRVRYVSPVLNGLCPLRVGDMAALDQVEEVARKLVHALEMASGLREPDALLEKLTTVQTQSRPAASLAGLSRREDPVVISFSGGVADCIEKTHSWLEYGDMGPVLGQMIRKSRLCEGPYRLGDETIRATVIGAGCHSAQLSGSTVFYQNMPLPLKNLPVVRVSPQEQAREDLGTVAARYLDRQEQPLAVLALPGLEAPGYAQVTAMAQSLAQGLAGRPVLIALEADMAKALGHALALRLPKQAQILCIDRLRLPQDSYLDIGASIGPALPVVIKTLILPH